MKKPEMIEITEYDEMWAIKWLVLSVLIFLITAIISALVFSGGNL